jgi:hypothetical protein
LSEAFTNGATAPIALAARKLRRVVVILKYSFIARGVRQSRVEGALRFGPLEDCIEPAVNLPENSEMPERRQSLYMATLP